MKLRSLSTLCTLLIIIQATSPILCRSTQAVILAAGKSSRFGTEKSKLLHTLCGREMILYPVKVFTELGIPTTVVVGHQAESITKTVLAQYPETTFVVQHEQKGTGHAVACTQEVWNKDCIVVLNGDMPLITKDLMQHLIACHHESHATVTFAVSHTYDIGAQGFGRVIQEHGTIKIVEVKHLKGKRDDFPLANVGIYVFDRDFLQKAIDKLEQHSLTQEFYITDLIEIADKLGRKVSPINVPFDTVRGINTIEEFTVAQALKRKELVCSWMNRGVLFSHPETVELDYTVSIGSGTSIGAGVHIKNKSSIGKNCIIEPYTLLTQARVEDGTTIPSHTVISHN